MYENLRPASPYGAVAVIRRAKAEVYCLQTGATTAQRVADPALLSNTADLIDVQGIIATSGRGVSVCRSQSEADQEWKI